MQIPARQGDTIDAICHRHYGRTAGTVEAVLDANPGIAALGPILPMGTTINLPDVPPPTTARQTVQLWT